MFHKKLDMAVLLAVAGVPLADLGILVALLMPLVQWIREAFR
jgi:hypothetical protein